MNQFLAVDIGGTSAKCALVGADGALRPLEGFATGSAMTRAELEQALLAILSRAGQVDGVGISTLGIVDPSRGAVLGGVENMPCLTGLCPAELLSSHRPGLPVRIVNDAAAAALGEQWLGAARGCRSFVCAAFGTGVGGCVVLDGRPVEGMCHRAGEIGYWDYTGPEDYWELSGSAQGLVAAARLRTGEPGLDGVAFFHRLAQEDPVCRELFASWTARTGRVFANIALLLDMERIVVGGGISAQGEVLTAPLQAAMDACLPPDFRGACRVVPAALGNHAALLGAVSALVQADGKQHCKE